MNSAHEANTKISREREGLRNKNDEEERKPIEMTIVASFFNSK